MICVLFLNCSFQELASHLKVKSLKKLSEWKENYNIICHAPVAKLYVVYVYIFIYFSEGCKLIIVFQYCHLLCYFL